MNSLDTWPFSVLGCAVPENQDDLLTVQEAAALLGISDATVRQAILGGRLECVRKYNRKLIPRAALEQYRARTQGAGVKRRGRPPQPRNSS